MFKNLSHRGVEGNDFTQMGCHRILFPERDDCSRARSKVLEVGASKSMRRGRSQKQTEALVNMFEKDSKGDGTKGEEGEEKQGEDDRWEQEEAVRERRERERGEYMLLINSAINTYVHMQ